MNVPLEAVEFFCTILLLSGDVTAAVTFCQSGACDGVLFEPVCLLCNVSRFWDDVRWLAADTMLADGGFIFEAKHAGGLVINGCPDYEYNSLRLDYPTTENHNLLYYCQRDETTISSFLLTLHVQTKVSINTSRASEEKLVLWYEESKVTLQCVIDNAYPPVVLTWLLNNNEEAKNMFNLSSTATTTFHFTKRFSNLKHNDTLTCSSEGKYIKSNNASLQIYVLSDKREPRLETAPTNGKQQEPQIETIWILAGLIGTSLLSVSAFIMFRCYSKNNSFSIENATGNPVSRNDDESGASFDQAYSQINTEVDRTYSETGNESSNMAQMSLISQLKVSGIYEYWTGTYGLDGIKEEICFTKSLSGQATLQEAADFQALAKRMKGLSESAHVVRLICININKNPFSIVYELMEYGTLRDFILSRYQQQPTSDPETREASLRTQTRELLAFANNIANAMAFLESQNFRHPVLSLKKVLLTSQCCCKLYDIYPSEMAMIKIEAVRRKNHPPVAWMSPETIFLHEYSLTSDTWGYSTLLWELFSLGEVPYAGKEIRVIEEQIRRGVFLAKPPNCPEVMYRTMVLAWSKSSTDRPSFGVILEKLKDIVESIKQDATTTAAQYFTLEAHQSNEYI